MSEKSKTSGHRARDPEEFMSNPMNAFTTTMLRIIMDPKVLVPLALLLWLNIVMQAGFRFALPTIVLLGMGWLWGARFVWSESYKGKRPLPFLDRRKGAAWGKRDDDQELLRLQTRVLELENELAARDEEERPSL